jgi:hypothetical protein
MKTKNQITKEEREKIEQDYKLRTDAHELKVLRNFVEFCKQDFVNAYMLSDVLRNLSHVILTTNSLITERGIPYDTVIQIMDECELYYYRRFLERLVNHSCYPILEEKILEVKKEIDSYRDSLVVYRYEFLGPGCKIILKSRGGKEPEQLKEEMNTVKAWAKSGIFKGSAVVQFSHN